MRSILFVFLSLSLFAHATLLSNDHGLARRHHSQLARRANTSRSSNRCKAKAATPSPSPNPKSPAPAPAAPPPPPPGVLSVQSSACGPNGATPDPGATNGPNGSQDWLNCGLYDGGWNPPYISIDRVIAMDLDQALADPSSPFQRCGPYIGLFKTYASQHNIPAIMIAAFALQESNCNPATVGGAGEQGLMQLTKDKCLAAPNGDCKDPDYNIRTGAQFFSDTLASNGGDVLLSIGHYNGWYKGLTYSAATAAANTDCCRCQNNVDYMQQYMNGWLQNKNVYGGWPRIGKVFNLDVCGIV